MTLDKLPSHVSKLINISGPRSISTQNQILLTELLALEKGLRAAKELRQEKLKSAALASNKLLNNEWLTDFKKFIVQKKIESSLTRSTNLFKNSQSSKKKYAINVNKNENDWPKFEKRLKLDTSKKYQIKEKEPRLYNSESASNSLKLQGPRSNLTKSNVLINDQIEKKMNKIENKYLSSKETLSRLSAQMSRMETNDSPKYKYDFRGLTDYINVFNLNKMPSILPRYMSTSIVINVPFRDNLDVNQNNVVCRTSQQSRVNMSTSCRALNMPINEYMEYWSQNESKLNNQGRNYKTTLHRDKKRNDDQKIITTIDNKQKRLMSTSSTTDKEIPVMFETSSGIEDETSVPFTPSNNVEKTLEEAKLSEVNPSQSLLATLDRINKLRLNLRREEKALKEITKSDPRNKVPEANSLENYHNNVFCSRLSRVTNDKTITHYPK